MMRDGSRQRVYGVDFSGAQDAGRRIWVAHGAVESEGLRILSCRRGDELPGSAPDRDACLAALGDQIPRSGTSIWGLDFPFGIPARLAYEESWTSFVLTFPGRYGSADAFREACREAAGGRELKRLTDKDAEAPFSAYNLRLFRQTYYGIRDLLHPLVRDDAARVLPMQEAAAEKPWLLEICPACTLKEAGLYGEPYKGRESAKRGVREGMVRALEERDALILDDETRLKVVENTGGDALDSVVAALAVAKALRDSERPAFEPGVPYNLEGYIYT
jgi:hypothetical protein